MKLNQTLQLTVLLLTPLTAFSRDDIIDDGSELFPIIRPIEPTPIIPLATVEYCTGFDFEDYQVVRDSFDGYVDVRPWGEHPMFWKKLISPNLNLNPVTSDDSGLRLFAGVPSHLWIEPGDAMRLNNYESSGTSTDANGNATDPVGGWLQNYVDDGQTMALMAAIAIWSWNTPVYLNIDNSSLANAPIPSVVGVIDCVTLSAQAGPPHAVCGWDRSNDDFIGQAETCPGLVIESVKMSFYSDALLGRNRSSSPFYYDWPVISGLDFVTMFNATISDGIIPEAGQVVYDPPKENNRDNALLDPYELLSFSKKMSEKLSLRSKHGKLTTVDLERK